MSTRSVRASGAERLERVEVMGSPVHQQYQRIVALLRMELGEGELNLLACPIADENGEPVAWKARSGRALTPVTDLPEDERRRLEGARDATLAKIDAMIERLKSRGAPGMVTAQVLAAAITLPEDGGTLYSDGLGPVLVDWGSRDRGAPSGDEETAPVPPSADEAEKRSADETGQAGGAGPEAGANDISDEPPEERAGHHRPAFWIPEADADPTGAERPGAPARESRHTHRLQIHAIEPLSDAEPPAEAAPLEAEAAAPAEETQTTTDMPRFLPLDAGAEVPARRPGEDGAEATADTGSEREETVEELPGEPVPVMPPRRRRLFARARRFSDRKPPWPASPPLVAESDEAFLRRQRREGRVVSADPLPQKSPARRRRHEPEGNALVWLVPAFIVGGITFYLSQSPSALEQLLARLPEPVARQFRPAQMLPDPLRGTTATPMATPSAPEVDGRKLSDRLARCFEPPAEAGTGPVTLSAMIDADGRLAEPATVAEGAAGPLAAAGVAAVNRCQPFVGAGGPALLTVTFGPGGPQSVQVEAVAERSPR